MVADHRVAADETAAFWCSFAGICYVPACVLRHAPSAGPRIHPVFVPNCCRKTHTMTSTGAGTWAGKLGGKAITLSTVSATELAHGTTDGPMRMTRDDPRN